MKLPCRAYVIATALAVVTLSAVGASTVAAASGRPALGARHQSGTATPVKHLVVIFQENISFDHYFGTYPNAANLPGETKFKAKANTPAVNGLSQGLLERNPNSIQPLRLDPSQNLQPG